MADFSALKTAIQANIRTNGNEEITGAILQDILLSMVSTMGDGAINALAEALQTEITNRQNAVSGEATTRAEADSGLSGRINAEATARGEADTLLQGAINGINTKLAEGYIYAGIATPSTDPSTPAGKVFYIALQAGTYTNFSSLAVTQGITILKYNGTAWSQEQLVAIDDVPTAGSNNLVKSGGVFPTFNAVNKALIPITGKVSIIGDSISTFSGTMPSGYFTHYPNSALGVTSLYDMWWHLLLSMTNSKLEVNASFSGSRVTNGIAGEGFPDFYDRTNILGSPDYIFVELGTNDSSASVVLGNYDYDTEDLSESEFIPAYIKGVKALKANYPNAKIVLFVFQMSDSYANAIKNIGKHYELDVIDVRSYYINNVHPNKLQMCSVAQTISSFYIRGKCDDEPTDGSNNLVKSGGVYSFFKNNSTETLIRGSKIPYSTKIDNRMLNADLTMTWSDSHYAKKYVLNPSIKKFVLAGKSIPSSSKVLACLFQPINNGANATWNTSYILGDSEIIINKDNFFVVIDTTKLPKMVDKTNYQLLVITSNDGYSDLYCLNTDYEYLPITFTIGSKYNENLELEAADFGCYAEVDVSDYQGQILEVCGKINGGVYSGFTDNSNTFRNIFQVFYYADNGQQYGYRRIKIPNNATKLKISAQYTADPGFPTVAIYTGEMPKRKVVFDSDINGDVDDIVALRTLFRMEDRGAIDVYGINISSCSLFSVLGVDGFCHNEGVTDMAIGFAKYDWANLRSSRYLELCSKQDTYYIDNMDVEDTKEFYKRLLDSLEPAETIDIIVVGNGNFLYGLLNKYGTKYKSKIDTIYVMGGKYPSGQEYNFCGQNDGSTNIIQAWTDWTAYLLSFKDLKIIFCGFEIGSQVFTGNSLHENSLTWDLVYRCLLAYGQQFAENGRSSWDPITTLVACDGNVENSCFSLIQGQNVIDTTTGINTFTEDVIGWQHFIMRYNQIGYRNNIAYRINKLLIDSTKKRDVKRLPRLAHLVNFIDLQINWQSGKLYNASGELVEQPACSYAEVDVSSYQKQPFRVHVSSHGSGYCLFIDENRNVISTFQTDTVIQGYDTFRSMAIPQNCKYLLLTTQNDIVSSVNDAFVKIKALA